MKLYLLPHIFLVFILVLFAFVRVVNFRNVNLHPKENLEVVILRHSYESGFQWVTQYRNINIYTQSKINFGEKLEVDINKCRFNNIYFCQEDSVVSVSKSRFSEVTDIRDSLIYRIQSRFHEPYASLLLGILLGYKADIPEDQKTLFREAGIMHIIVASGFNVGVVVTLFLGLSYFSNSKGIVLPIIVLVMCYCFLVGAEIPIVRATIAGVYILLARMLGKIPYQFYILLISFLLILIFNPYAFHSISFWMTYTAVLFLVLSGMVIKSESILVNEFGSVLMVNLGLAPILINTFGQFSISGLAINPLISFAIPYVTFLGIANLIFPNNAFELITILLMDYVYWISNNFLIFDSLEFNKGLFSMMEIVVYYLIVISFLIFLSKRSLITKSNWKI